MPNSEGFTNPKGAPAKITHQLVGTIRKIRQSSINADFDNKLNMASHMRFRDTKSEEFFLRRSIFFLAANWKTKGDRKWSGPGIVIGRFGGNMR